MIFNLIHDAWIPVRRQDETRAIIAPWQITEDRDHNPIIALDAARADFNGALIQFLIGLVQTVIPPKDDRAWRAGVTNPPEMNVLKQGFEVVAFAFDLDGDGPRFMQEVDLQDGKRHPASYLLIDAPTEKPQEENTDHFVKRELFLRSGATAGLCLACASVALYTLQLFAPQGGAGKFTGLRGGGPMTTLIAGGSLWETVWLNVLVQADIQALGNVRRGFKTFDERIFPWLNPNSLIEEKSGKGVYLVDVHPAHMYWPMPRRILLEFQKAASDCILCGERTPVQITHYRDTTSGIHYKPPWRHPLSPHYLSSSDQMLLPRLGSSVDDVSYRHWLGWVVADTADGAEPARVVQKFIHRRQSSRFHEILSRGPRLWAFGYKMAKMNARAWYESSMPLVLVDESLRPAYESIVERLVRTAIVVGDNVRYCIKQAMFRDPKRVRGDFSVIDVRFWQTTESAFYSLLEQCREQLSTGGDLTPLKMEWVKTLARAGERIFDDLSQNKQLEVAEPKRIAKAYQGMRRLNAPTNRKIREILDLPKDI